MPKPKELKEKVVKERNIIPEIIRDERPEKVKTLLCRGLDRPNILAYAQETGWDASPAQVDAWIEAADAELAEEAGSINTEAELGKSLARLNYLYMQAAKVQDHKTALSIQKEINKILALKVTADSLRSPAAATEGRPARQGISLVK